MDPFDVREILVPLDGSGTAEWALRPALAIAGRADARVRLFRCLTSLTRAFPDVTAAGYLEEWQERQHATEAEYLGILAGHLRDLGLEASAETVEDDPVGAIVDAAADADLVVMTAHGWSGSERAWLGHVADGVLHHVHCPVIVVRGESSDGPERPLGDPGIQRILVATDGTAAARSAERHAAGLARLHAAELFVFRAIPTPAGPSSPYIPHAAALDRETAAEREAGAHRYLERLVAELEEEGLDTTPISRLTYHVAREILDVATETQADLLAVGTHRDSRLARIVLGSVADKVVRGAGIPVLVAHAH